MLSTLQVTTREQERFAAALALIAGYVDAYAAIHFHTYVSFMSGNTTQTGSQLGQGSLAGALPSALAILCFVMGVVAGTLLAHSSVRQPRRFLLGSVAVLLVLDIAVAGFGNGASGLDIMVLSFAMGCMNTALSYVGAQSTHLTFVTGTLNAFGQHLALAVKKAPLPDSQGEWDTHARRALLLFGVWAAFFTGALLGGLLVTVIGVSVLPLPAAILVLLAIYEHVRTS